MVAVKEEEAEETRQNTIPSDRPAEGASVHPHTPTGILTCVPLQSEQDVFLYIACELGGLFICMK